MHTPNPSDAAGWERDGVVTLATGSIWLVWDSFGSKEKRGGSKKRLREKKKGNWGWGFIPAAPDQVDLAESLGIESFQRLGKPTRVQPTGVKCPRVMLLEEKGACSQGY